MLLETYFECGVFVWGDARKSWDLSAGGLWKWYQNKTVILCFYDEPAGGGGELETPIVEKIKIQNMA
jgi:hypothetical protein